MPSTVKEKLSHQSIVVKTVGKPTAFGTSGQKLSFASEDKSYVCFISALFTELTPNNTIDADIEVRESGEFVNNVVTQIYKDGKPIAGKKMGYPPRFGGHTPEEQTSKENQVRAKIIAELWIGKAIDGDSALVHKLVDWLNVLSESPKISPIKSGVIPEVAPQPQGAVTATTGAEKQGGEVIHRTAKDLVNIAKEKGYDSSNVTAIIVRHFNKAKASELEPEQIDWLYDQMKDGKMKVEAKK